MVIVPLMVCNSSELPRVELETEIIIDWVDFVKVNDHQYSALHTAAISDESVTR